MARIRSVKPEFFDDPEMAELTPLARLFFIGLWTQADREGRLNDDARRLRARLFAYDVDVNVEALIVELHGKDMVRRYQDADGKRFIWIRSFAKHQRPHPKEPASVIPACHRGAGKLHGEPGKEPASKVGSCLLVLDTLDTLVIPEPGKKQASAHADAFAGFWAVYPKKTGKAAALASWLRKVNPSIAKAVIAAVVQQKAWPEWTREQGRFIPNPATWLNQGRWEDEVHVQGPDIPRIEDIMAKWPSIEKN